MNELETIDIRTGRPFAGLQKTREHGSIPGESIDGNWGRARGLLGGAFVGAMLAQNAKSKQGYTTIGLNVTSYSVYGKFVLKGTLADGAASCFVDFGDGTTGEFVGETIIHNYSKNGRYIVSIDDSIRDISFYNNIYSDTRPILTVDMSNADRIEKISSYALYSASSITSFLFPPNLTRINDHAFQTAFSSSNKPPCDLSKTKLEYVGSYGIGSSNVSSVTFPSTLRELANEALRDSNQIEFVRFSSMTAPKIGLYTFRRGNTTVPHSILIPRGAAGYSGGGWDNAVNLYGFTIEEYD